MRSNRDGEAGLCPAQPKRGKAWKPFEGFHFNRNGGAGLCSKPFEGFHIGALLLAAVWFAATAGCADFQRGPAPRDAAPNASDAVPPVADFTFETMVYPILQARCEDCHKVGREGAYTKLVLSGNARSDRAMVVALVTPGNPADSLLLLRATGNAHTGGQRLAVDSADYQTIADWIFVLDPVAQAMVQP
jgi:hypothetical protein